LFCYSDTDFGGVPCSTGLFGAGGTSFASPIVAGFQSLVNQFTGSAWGNPNPVLYSLARTEYGASGKASCNSSLGNAVSSGCTFYDVTLGDNDAVCVAGTPNCYAPSGALGVLSTSTSSYHPAFTTTTGWDFATGIGTINANNLVKNWSSGALGAVSKP
jgi:subtilase family serine protease